MNQLRTCQVVVVGAGPVGTTMATLLAQAGIDTIVLESGQDCAQDMRASTFHAPTLEMFDQIGITPMLLERGLKAPVYNWRDRASGEVISFDMSELADMTRYPFRIQCEQYHLARALAEGLETLPSAEIRFNSRFLSMEQDGEGVTVHAERAFGVERIRCDWLIGADGANSLVRKWLAIGFDGFTYPEKFLCLTTDRNLSEDMPDLAHVNYVADAREWLVLLRVPSLWRVLVPANPEQSDDELRSDANKDDVFSRIVNGGGPVTTHHRTIYRVHQRVAKSFIDGRAMLIGDAAHLNNPLGGFGMNSGVHDAFNLFEKLEPVIARGASAEGLARFDRQRRQATFDFVQAQTIRNMELMSSAAGESRERQRGELRATRDDDAKRRTYLVRNAMFESLEHAATIQ